MDEFYIGYLPQAPSELAKRIRRLVVLIFAGCATIGGVLALQQRPFAESNFDYGNVRQFEGRLYLDDVPRLLTPEGTAVLVGEGKHGVAFPRADHGRLTMIAGTGISRAGMRLIEVADERPSPGSSVIQQDTVPKSSITLEGEILDSKCYAGVMNPGQGKVHRACAARCLHGGIPAALLSGDHLYYLAGKGAATLSAIAGERVKISGTLTEKDGLSVVYIDRLESH